MLVKCMNFKKLESYLRVNLLGPGPCLIKKKNLTGRGLTKVENTALGKGTKGLRTLHRIYL
jgi:hypothetical protein